MRFSGLPILCGGKLHEAASGLFLEVEKYTSQVLQLTDQTEFLQRLICYTSLLFLARSSTFSKSFILMGIFELDKLHCLHGDK